jgi:uncharacterized membrane protein
MIVRNRFVEPSTAGTTESASLGFLVVTIFAPGWPLMAKMLVAAAFALAGTALFLRILRSVPLRDAMLVPLVGMLCLRTDWARRLTDWRKAPQAWSSVTLWHFAYLTIVIACGLALWLLCRVCRRAGGNLLGRVGSWVFGLIYGGCFLCASGSFGACLCGDILYSDRMNQSHKKERQIIALINVIGGKWLEILLLALVIGLALYTLFRLEEDPRKS